MEKRGPKKMRRKGEKKSKVGREVRSKEGRDNGERDQHKNERGVHKNERDTGERDQHKSESGVHKENKVHKNERNSHKGKDLHKNKVPPSSSSHPSLSHPHNFTLTPYQVLGLPPASSKDQIDKAFTKLRLKYHPDRKTGDRNKYDQIVEAYNEIKNKKEEDREYLEVNSFIKNYKDSEEEIRDLLDLYKKFKGNYKKIIKYHLLTEEEDEERIRGIIEREIELENVNGRGSKEVVGGSKEVGNGGKPNRTTPSKNILNKKRIKEKKKAEQLALEMGIDLNQSLEEILNKGKKKEKKFLEDLERKYLRRLE
ncbi:DnaJ subfamily C member 9 [Nosema bombycis CQ1]|uniref:DnaJ subfamily C member 9 n=1 Tax=Nosema bombycis (strain CQ1 / CVCC 102059) TaxID=578461 RepID=R0KT91_NOSB1|nr:DnaJ subfamily C member 9 [Nosema bombycis CQ1]|eukprot:EOB14021.1 DnaJ subfamily C member 9 [Nosema bombycis CQ1]